MNVYDWHGNKLNKGDRVEVHQDEGVSMATVVETFPDNPTINEPGHWVDIEKDNMGGVEGIPSYLLEKRFSR